MAFLDRMERRFGWLSFPGFLRYYALFHLMVYLLQVVQQDIGLILAFDRAAIAAGEYWRVVTFLFASSGMAGMGMLGAVFMFFMVYIGMLICNSLEESWGVFRTTMFHYTGIAATIGANFLFPQSVVGTGSGFLVYQSAFFAFATLFPNLEFRLFLILPIKVKVLAWIIAGLMVVNAASNPVALAYLAICLVNYLLWCAIPFFRGRKALARAAVRRQRFDSSKRPESEPFYRCVTCDRTDRSDPELEFRVAADGKEYCEEHLPPD